MIKVYEKRFNEKIDHFKEHPRYDQLRKSADRAIRNHTGYGLEAIAAQEFMDRIVVMPLQYIEDWLNGKNELKWTEEYEAISLVDALNNPIK